MNEASPQQGRKSNRVRKKAPVLEDENFVRAPGGNSRAEDADSSPPGLYSSSRSAEEDTSHIPIDKKLTMIYGKHRPPDAPKDVCAVCLKESQFSTEVVLLCDGFQCHREYHLSCANLLRVPDEDEPFYCFDCHPVGARTEALQKYLEQHNDSRDVPESEEVWSQEGVWRQLIAQDLDRRRSLNNNSPKTSSAKKKALEDDAATSTTTAAKVPRSELHNPRLWLSRDGPTNTPNERPFLIGCPLRLYVPQLNNYVAGRIIDHREHEGRQEHYVRFPAGAPEMKKPVHAWMILEEHALLVNTGVVVVMTAGAAATTAAASLESNSNTVTSPANHGKKRPHSELGNITSSPENNGKANHHPPSPRRSSMYKVAAAWARTSRELLSVKNIEALSIPFYNGDETPWTFPTPRRSDCARTVMIRYLGSSNQYRFIDAANLRDLDLTKDGDSVDPIAFSLAKSELMEKKRVRDWYSLRSQKPISLGGSLKRDVDELPPLYTQPDVKPFSLTKGKHVEPCPYVLQGLDRVYVAERLKKLGIPVDTMIAGKMECDSAKPFYSVTSKYSS